MRGRRGSPPPLSPPLLLLLLLLLALMPALSTAAAAAAAGQQAAAAGSHAAAQPPAASAGAGAGDAGSAADGLTCLDFRAEGLPDGNPAYLQNRAGGHRCAALGAMRQAIAARGNCSAMTSSKPGFAVEHCRANATDGLVVVTAPPLGDSSSESSGNDGSSSVVGGPLGPADVFRVRIAGPELLDARPVGRCSNGSTYFYLYALHLEGAYNIQVMHMFHNFTFDAHPVPNADLHLAEGQTYLSKNRPGPLSSACGLNPDASACPLCASPEAVARGRWVTRDFETASKVARACHFDYGGCDHGGYFVKMTQEPMPEDLRWQPYGCRLRHTDPEQIATPQCVGRDPASLFSDNDDDKGDHGDSSSGSGSSAGTRRAMLSGQGHGQQQQQQQQKKTDEQHEQKGGQQQQQRKQQRRRHICFVGDSQLRVAFNSMVMAFNSTAPTLEAMKQFPHKSVLQAPFASFFWNRFGVFSGSLADAAAAKAAADAAAGAESDVAVAMEVVTGGGGSFGGSFGGGGGSSSSSAPPHATHGDDHHLQHHLQQHGVRVQREEEAAGAADGARLEEEARRRRARHHPAEALPFCPLESFKGERMDDITITDTDALEICTDVVANFGQWPASYEWDVRSPLGSAFARGGSGAPMSAERYAVHVVRTARILQELRARGKRVLWAANNPFPLSNRFETYGTRDFRAGPTLPLYNELAAVVMRRHGVPVLDTHAIGDYLSETSFDQAHYVGQVGYAITTALLDWLCGSSGGF